MHAITDALLGAAGLEDIGQRFPNSDPANRGRDSAEMLEQAYAAVLASGWRLVNLDCVVFLEQPKIAPSRSELRRRIAEILNVPLESVNVKGKTGEGVGPVGRREAISAQCVALLEPGS